MLSADPISTMLAAASPREAALVVLMVVVGAMRVGEATLLAWEDVEGCTVSIPGAVTKTGLFRRFTLPPAACQWLQAWRAVWLGLPWAGWPAPQRPRRSDRHQQVGRDGGYRRGEQPQLPPQRPHRQGSSEVNGASPVRSGRLWRHTQDPFV